MKRSNITSDAIERALDASREREKQIALALRAPAEKTLFEFGRLCGMAQENQANQLAIEHSLDECDPMGRREES